MDDCRNETDWFLILAFVLLIAFTLCFIYSVYWVVVQVPHEHDLACRHFEYDGYSFGYGCVKDLGNGTLETTELNYINGKPYLDGSTFYRSK